MPDLVALSEALRPHQPLMQLVQLVVVTFGVARYWAQQRQLHLDEAKARQQGIDPERAERTGTP